MSSSSPVRNPEKSGPSTGNSRMSLAEGADQISRIFFGNNQNQQQQYQGSYGAPSYGPPAYNPSGAGTSYSPASGLYNPYNELHLTLQLGQAALIVFIIAAIVFVLFLLLVACLFCTGHLGGGGKNDSHTVVHQAPYNNHEYPGGYDDKNTRGWAISPTSTSGTLSRTYGNGIDNLSGTDSHDGPLPDISTTTSSTETPQQQPQQTPKRSRSHTPSGKRKHRSSHHHQPDSDNNTSTSAATWNRPATTTAATDLQTTTTPTSVSTGETVVPRRLPPAPPQTSSNSTSTDLSLPRSMPYYEVPAARIPYTDRQTSIPATSPPAVPVSSYQNGDAYAPGRNTSYPYREQRPYTQIDRSRLV